MASVIPISQPQGLVGVSDVASYLGMSEAWVKNHAHEIPGLWEMKCGARHVRRWDMNRVRRWIDEQEHARRNEVRQ